MKTLYDKLSEENRQKIDERAEDLPHFFPEIIENMKKEEYFINLKLKDCAEIFWTIYPNRIFDYTDFYKLFENE